MSSKVYFITSRIIKQKGLLEKFAQLLEYLSLDFFDKNSSVLIKTHFGEEGNTAFISPLYIRKVVDFVKEKKANPFIGDTNTLYRGDRKSRVTHLELAHTHRFNYANLQETIVILDGLKSEFSKKVAIQKKYFQTVDLAGEFVNCDAAIILSHVKGHIVAGLGASLKNLAMGLGTRTQKQKMHGDIKPSLNHKKCIQCKKCIQICPPEAITLKNNKIEIDLDNCIGCAECITHCPTGAIKILWNETPKKLAEKITETAYAAHKIKQNKIYYFNFIIDVTPDCDCMNWSDNAVVNDIGILASKDPIAIDKASYDLVNKAKKLANSVLENKEGEVFKLMNNSTFPETQFNYGAEIGLGNTEYELIELEW